MQRIRHLGRARRRALDQDAAAVRLLADYLDSVSRSIDSISLGAIPAVRNATTELVSAALQVHPTGGPTNPVAVICLAQRYIDTNLRRPDLAPPTVAAALGLSLRSLHRAFEDSGLSVAEIVRARRLAAAGDDLLAGATVAFAARRWPFSDASHFPARSSERQYGMAPGEGRATRT